MPLQGIYRACLGRMRIFGMENRVMSFTICHKFHVLRPALRGLLCLLIILLMLRTPARAQNYEPRSILYNSLIGAFSGGIGSLINKTKDQKWYEAFGKGFLTGLGGGAVCYTGKKLNYFIAKKSELGYGWLSRVVFSAGNSVVENASANRDFWSVWHYDIGFIRLEYNVAQKSLTPRIMPSTFAGTVFLAVKGKFDAGTSLKSGSLTFRAGDIGYSPRFVASTPTNGFLIRDSLYTTGPDFYDVYAHEMVHAFQFQEFSGVNYFFRPLTDKWKAKSPWFAKWSKYIYGDLNYEIMGINYFLIQKGHKVKDYCSNFLENEAESLTTGRPACPVKQ